MTNALEIEGLTKTYGSGFEALKGIDLHVAQGISLHCWAQTVQANQPRLALCVRW